MASTGVPTTVMIASVMFMLAAEALKSPNLKSEPADGRGKKKQPSIVFVLTDDQDLYLGSMDKNGPMQVVLFQADACKPKM